MGDHGVRQMETARLLEVTVQLIGHLDPCKLLSPHCRCRGVPLNSGMHGRIIPGASGDSGIGSWRVSTEGSYGDSVLTPGESVLHIKGQLLSSEDLMLPGM